MSLIGHLVLRGLAAGLVAGLAAAIFGLVAGEPQIERAIALEPHAANPLVGRAGQERGLVLAAALYGMAVGGLFGLAFAFVRGRIGPRRDAALAAALGAALFVGAVLVPFGKYPAGPPGVGDPDTLRERTLLYLVMLAIGLASVLAAARIARSAPLRVRVPAAAATLILLVGFAYVLLPGVDEVPAGFSSDLLLDFRLASLGTQFVLWASLTALFACLAPRRAAAP